MTNKHNITNNTNSTNRYADIIASIFKQRNGNHVQQVSFSMARQLNKYSFKGSDLNVRRSSMQNTCPKHLFCTRDICNLSLQAKMLCFKMLSNFYSFYLTAITDTHLSAEFSNAANYLQVSPVLVMMQCYKDLFQ